MRTDYVRIQEIDNVVVVTRDFSQAEILDLAEGPLRLKHAIPKGHKVAIRAIPAGGQVVKYGYSIGQAVADIPPGAWVHVHNLKSGLHGLLEYEYQPVDRADLLSRGPQATTVGRDVGDAQGSKESKDPISFMGYLRPDGEVGIRNEIWLINTVGCINKTCEVIAKTANEQFRGRGFDGVYHFAHPFGCSQLGDDLHHTQLLLASLVQHPNAAGVLVVGLGCENNHIGEFKKALGDYDAQRVRFLSVQSEPDEMDAALQQIQDLVAYAETFTRQPLPVSLLKVGLKCGGSDGFSGITANPLVGAFSDLLVGHGGSTILTEVPEMFGAETLLMNRAENRAVFEKTVRLINDFKGYFMAHGQEVYENPSPGNKDGGITTLEEKSLGCTQKGGNSLVVDVTAYGRRVAKRGLNLLEAPGNDLVSVTALTAAGAHIVLFTTGRGTPFGGPVPTVKVSTNTALAERKRHWIDFNAGQLLDGRSLESLKQEFFDTILQVASGEVLTHNERNGYREIAIFKDGVIL